MAAFTTRPEIVGTFGVVASTHWIASAVGMSMLEKGGNAFDAAVAAGLVLQVVEPHLNGPGGDLPAVIRAGSAGAVEVINGQGPAPARATIEHYRREGIELIPGDGLLATVIPGAFDAWMLMLRNYGRLRLRDVLQPAIHYAREGHPLLESASWAIAERGEFFRGQWPTSFLTWLPGGAVPSPGSMFRNPVLAATWTRLLTEAEGKKDRESQIEAARKAFYSGFVAESIDRYLREAVVKDETGESHRGVLCGDDLSGWEADVEAPTTYDYNGWTVAKTGPWGQGPVLLQSLALLAGTDLSAMGPQSAEFVHVVTEAQKLAFADREVYYGDPRYSHVPLDHLLSADYNESRRRLIGSAASLELRPGLVPGYDKQVNETLAMLTRLSQTGSSVYEPTMSHLSRRTGDTVHIDVIDCEGNLVSATPSGGWLQSSPVIPDLGFCLNSRAQMFWLEPGLPTSLAPGRRPRTTLTPSLALHPDGSALCFGTPGGDQQDQWQLVFLLRYIHHGLNLQEAIDLPMFHNTHFPASFYPRTRKPGNLTVESQFGEKVLGSLAARGHDLTISEPWSIGRLTAASRDPRGLLRAAATPRLMQAYAVGR